MTFFLSEPNSRYVTKTEAEKSLEDLSLCVLTVLGLGFGNVTLPFIACVFCMSYKIIWKNCLKPDMESTFKCQFIIANTIFSAYL